MTADVVQLSPDKIKFSTIDEAIKEIRNGGFAILADDDGRENDGVLICAAAGIAADMVNFMMKEARGMISVALTRDRAQDLEMLAEEGQIVGVDAGAEFGVTSGLSATDRATTIQRLASSNAVPEDFVRPGHVFPLVAKNGGVLRQVGAAEAATDLVRLAGFAPMGVLCEILNDEGDIARRDELVNFAKKHNLPFITTAQVIEYRLERERFVLRKLAVDLPTRFGDFTAVGYKDTISGVEHLALVKGDLEELKTGTPLVRIHHEESIVDLLGENDSVNVQQMESAMTFINAQGSGVVVYLRGGKEGSGGGMIAALKAYSRKITAGPQNPLRASKKKDLRDYGVGAQILSDLGVTRFRHITNAPRKIVGLKGYGLEVVENVHFPEGKFEFAPRAVLTEATREKAQQQVPPKAETKPEKNPEERPELKAEKKEARAMTMKMGAQIISGQALFEG